jgi:hypothetical protein
MADQSLQIVITAITKGAAEVKSSGAGMVSVFSRVPRRDRRTSDNPFCC